VGVIKRFDHVAIAVRSIDNAMSWFVENLGATVNQPKTLGMADEFHWADFVLGGTKIELVEPIGQGPIHDFIETRGEGLHHLSMEVHNIREAIRHLESRGIRIVDVSIENPDGFQYAYISPRSACGTLIQIYEMTEPHAPESSGGER
jgi:methylmalonyl-CoA epimerase